MEPKHEKLCLHEVLYYEIASSWWLIVMPSFTHGIISRYFVRKVIRKYRRYEEILEIGEEN